MKIERTNIKMEMTESEYLSIKKALFTNLRNAEKAYEFYSNKSFNSDTISNVNKAKIAEKGYDEAKKAYDLFTME